MKDIYLLIFSNLLNNYYYLCEICEYLPPGDCEGHIAVYDDAMEGDYFSYCKFNAGDCEASGRLLLSKINCQNVVEKFSSDGWPIEDHVCPRLNSNKYFCAFVEGDVNTCKIKYCKDIKENCDKLDHCTLDGDTCIVTNCEGFYTENDCTFITSGDTKIYCLWENDSCKKKPNCTDDGTDISKCSVYLTSGDDYKCFSNGTKCVEANSCESVQLSAGVSNDVSTAACSSFPHCIPGEDNDCANKCNDIKEQNKCKYTLKNKEEDEKIFIKCKWVEDGPEGKKCQVDDDTEIKTCDDAKTITDLTNDQCSILHIKESSNKYCIKGPEGCFEYGDCEDINFEVDSNICLELTKPENDTQCISNGENGCKREKVKCTDYTLYIYNKVLCRNLDASEGYKCFSNGEKCIEANSCNSINNTIYDTESEELKKICDLFDDCEPYEKGCKTKLIPTTIVTTILTTILTTIPTTILTTIPTTILTTIPTTILTTIPTTILTTIPTTILTIIPTTILTTSPTTILTTIPTTILTTMPTIKETTVPTTIATTMSTNILTEKPSTILTAEPSISQTTEPSTILITKPSIIQTTEPTTIQTAIQTLISNTLSSTKPTSATTELLTNLPTTINTIKPTEKEKESTIIYPSTTTEQTISLQTTIPTFISTAISQTNLPIIKEEETTPNTIFTTIMKEMPTTINSEIPTTIYKETTLSTITNIEPSTIIKMVSTAITNDEQTTIKEINPTTFPTTIQTTIESIEETINNTIKPTTIPTIEQTTTGTETQTTIASTVSSTDNIKTNIPTTTTSTIIPTIKATTESTTMMTDILTTNTKTTLATNNPTTTTKETTIPSTISETNTPTDEQTEIPAIPSTISEINTPTKEPISSTLLETNAPMKESTEIPTIISTTTPNYISSSEAKIIPSTISTKSSTTLEIILETEPKTIQAPTTNTKSKEESEQVIESEQEKEKETKEILTSEYNNDATEEESTSQSTPTLSEPIIETTIPTTYKETKTETTPSTNQPTTESKLSTDIPPESNSYYISTTNKEVNPLTESNEAQTTIIDNTQGNNIFSTNLKATIVSNIDSSDTILSNLSSNKQNDIPSTNPVIKTEQIISNDKSSFL